MYHIAVVASNQEETPVLSRVRDTFAIRRYPLFYTFLDSPQKLEAFLVQVRPDYLFLSTEFSATVQVEYLTVLSAAMRKTKRVIPVLYLINWKQRLITMLGTEWSNNVGVLHSFTNQTEIIDQFQRLDGWGVTVGR